MKKIIFALIALSLGVTISAQVLMNGDMANQFPNENVFMDASTLNNSTVNDGKGLLFPTTDLTAFTFKTDILDGINFPSAFDGMIVYNIASGETLAGNGVVTPVVPGFYYFYNPGQSTEITNGRWLPLGGSGKVDVTTSETTTNNMVAGAQIYAIKGEFVATGTSTAVTIGPHAGVGSMYAITIYRAGSNSVYSRELYSYNVATGAAITGSPHISVVYPAGTYQYVLEYLR